LVIPVTVGSFRSNSRHRSGSSFGYNNSYDRSRHGSIYRGTIYNRHGHSSYNRNYNRGNNHYPSYSRHSYGHTYSPNYSSQYRNNSYAPGYTPGNSSGHSYSNNSGDYNAHGWQYLSAGNTAQAVNAFGLAAQHSPNHAGAKVGYALAHTVSGDYARGAWAMRRAIAADPYALKQVAIDSAVNQQLHGVIYGYQSNYRNSDHAFMTAALAYMTNDKSSAERAIRDARKYGDRSSEAKKLKQLIAKM